MYNEEYVRRKDEEIERRVAKIEEASARETRFRKAKNALM